MDAPKVKKIHPKIGTRMKMSRLQAKAPKKRHFLEEMETISVGYW